MTFHAWKIWILNSMTFLGSVCTLFDNCSSCIQLSILVSSWTKWQCEKATSDIMTLQLILYQQHRPNTHSLEFIRISVHNEWPQQKHRNENFRKVEQHTCVSRSVTSRLILFKCLLTKLISDCVHKNTTDLDHYTPTVLISRSTSVMLPAHLSPV